MPFSMRRRAQTLRWPSPTKGDSARTLRIALVSSASDQGVLGPRFLGGLDSAASLAVVVGRSRNAPGLADPRHTVDTTRGGRHGVAHGLDLRVRKGRPSLIRIPSWRISLRMVSSPTMALRRTPPRRGRRADSS